MQGWILPHHEDRDGDSTRCHVCGGSGTIPDDEYAAWMQDPAFVRNLSEYTPQNYSDFYAHALPPVQRKRGPCGQDADYDTRRIRRV
jgi:hypothetical protein